MVPVTEQNRSLASLPSLPKDTSKPAREQKQEVARVREAERAAKRSEAAQRRSTAAERRMSDKDAKHTVRAEQKAAASASRAAKKLAQDKILDEANAMKRITSKAHVIDRQGPGGKLAADANKLALLVGFSRSISIHRIAEWSDVTKVEVDGHEAQTIKTSGRSRERGAFHVLASEHGKQSGTATVAAECFVHIWTRSRGEIVVASSDGPAGVRARLGPFVHAISNAEQAEAMAKPTPSLPAAGNSLAAELRELKGLLDDGILTEDEFAEMKRAVLARNKG